jgi:hypothetical protein
MAWSIFPRTRSIAPTVRPGSTPYAQAIPRRDGDDALWVNWCELTTTDEKGHVLYHNSFATSLALDDRQVSEVVAAGCSRWKIENENNKTLKTKGYHFEHNYGHGQQHLSSVSASLIILAFLVHTVLEWMDGQYQLLRRKLPSRRRLFGDIRTLTSYLCFESWEALMTFMLHTQRQKKFNRVWRAPTCAVWRWVWSRALASTV